MPIRLRSLLALAAVSVLSAQGVFNNVNKPGDPTCPRIMRDKTSLNFGGYGPPSTTAGLRGADTVAVRYSQQGDWIFPPADRKDVSAFAAYDERSKGTSIASLKGKVVLVGLWSKNCDPSAQMLREFASIYPKRAQAGFEILAVNFDENQQDGGGIEGGWRAINKFMIRNRQFFQENKMQVFTPGLGKEGPANFMDMVYSLPVLFVVDRQGKLAEIHIGYKDGFVGEAVMRALRERPQPIAPLAPAPEPAKPAQP